jgi:hypothetical protein
MKHKETVHMMNKIEPYSIDPMHYCPLDRQMSIPLYVNALPLLMCVGLCALPGKCVDIVLLSLTMKLSSAYPL